MDQPMFDITSPYIAKSGRGRVGLNTQPAMHQWAAPVAYDSSVGYTPAQALQPDAVQNTQVVENAAQGRPVPDRKATPPKAVPRTSNGPSLEQRQFNDAVYKMNQNDNRDVSRARQEQAYMQQQQQAVAEQQAMAQMDAQAVQNTELQQRTNNASGHIWNGGGADGIGNWGALGDAGDTIASWFGQGDGMGERLIPHQDNSQHPGLNQSQSNWR